MTEALEGQPTGVRERVFAQTPLSLPGWVEFNSRKWGVVAHHAVLAAEGKARPAVEAVWYTNKAGQMVMPRLNPYLPVEFYPTATEMVSRLGRQWLSAGGMLADEWHKLGLAGTISLHPGIVDVRPFQWSGLRAGVRYTYRIACPFDIRAADKDIGRRAQNAQEAGFYCALTQEMAEAIACIEETETRQEFGYRLRVDDLKLALELLGGEYFRVYVCYGPQKQPVSCLVLIHHPGCWAVGLAQGILREHLSSGATQLMYRYVLEDLQKAGACGYDFAGANLPLVSAFKLQWGSQLLPLYCLEQYSWRSTARFVYEWYKAVKNRRKNR